MSSKKDYIAVAAAIAKAYHESAEAKGEIADLAYTIADIFAADNKLFSREKFLEACQVSA